MSEPILSVRARHKLETISMIHDIAVKLALEKGLVNAKVEDIAAATGISKRTFFNYFPTKEDAVLGLQTPSLPEGATERFNNATSDVITQAALLVLEVTRTATVPGSSLERRKELRRRFPELYPRFEFRAMAAEAIVRPLVADCMRRNDPDTSDQEIDVILRLAGTIIRYAYVIDPEIKDASITQSITAFKTTIRKTL